MSDRAGGIDRCRSRAARWLAAMALVTFPLLALAPASAGAATDDGASVKIVASEPVSDFPRGMTFPVVATSDEEITGVDLLYRAAYIETLNEVGLPIEPATTIDTSYELDLRDGSIPPGIEILYRWRVTEADGDMVETEDAPVTWLDTRFTWDEASSPRVQVASYGRGADFNQQVLASAETTIDRLSERFSAEMTHPIRIWVYNSREDFTGSLAPNSEPWIVGAAYPWLGLINAVLPPSNPDELGRVIPHEISHQVLFQATQNPFNQPPSWLEEGLATLAQTGGTASLWRAVEAAAGADQLDELRVLNGQFPYDSGEAMLAYGESMSVVTYLLDTYGEEGLSRLIAVLENGITYDAAVQQALGISLDQLSDDWHEAAQAQAQQELKDLGATGIGGFTDLGGWGADLLASGSLIMAVVAVLAVVAVVRSRRRARQEWTDSDDGLQETGYPGGSPAVRLPTNGNGAHL